MPPYLAVYIKQFLNVMKKRIKQTALVFGVLVLMGTTLSGSLAWEKMPGNARDIGAGADGSVYCVAPGGIVYQWNENAFAWMNVGGQAQRVAVDASGRPWVVTGENKIYRLRGMTWQAMPGDARDIGTGADGSVWVVAPGGIVYAWNENAFAWQNMGGKAKRISVSADGRPWVVTDENKVYRLRGQTWQAMPGDARDVAGGADGSIWCLSPGGISYMWNENAFAWQNMAGNQSEEITVGPDGTAWVVTQENEIYRNRMAGGMN